MVDYIRSDPPTAVVSTDDVNETLRVVVTNPTPTGSRPVVVTNSIYRRTTGSTGVWTLAGTTGNNGTFTDQFLRSATGYDYFVRTDTFADSPTYTGTSPFVTGLWMYSTADPSTIAHYPYTDGGAESLDEDEVVVPLVGRVYPIVESGIQEQQVVKAVVTVPFSVTHRADVEWWRNRKRDRQTVLYRDGRGRVFACRLVGGIDIAPAGHGTIVSATLQRVDYAASTVTLDPLLYQGGAYNDGGNGAYGNGAQGNGL